MSQSPESSLTTPRSQAGFFEEDNGTKSSMRLMSFVALIASIVFGALTITNSGGRDSQSTGIYITFGFLLSAFAPKAVQKFAEEKIQ